jgi:hypothetical protein
MSDNERAQRQRDYRGVLGTGMDWSYDKERYILEELFHSSKDADEVYVSRCGVAYLALNLLHLEERAQDGKESVSDAELIRAGLEKLLHNLSFDVNRESETDDERGREMSRLAEQLNQAYNLIYRPEATL